MVGHDQLAAYVEERRGERRHALNVVDTVPHPCRDPKSVARLMREAIRGHQWSSVVISPCRDPKSVARLRSSVVISGHHWSSMVISGHQRSSAVMSGHCSSVAVMRHHGHQRSLGVIRGHIGPVEAISCNLMQSHACDSTTQRRTCPSVSSGRSVGSFDCTYARPSLERVGRR